MLLLVSLHHRSSGSSGRLAYTMRKGCNPPPILRQDTTSNPLSMRKCILHRCRHRTSRSNMFEEQETAPRTQHTPDLTQAALWIMYGTQNEGRHHAVERSIWEGEPFAGSACELDGNGRLCSTSPCVDQHRFIRLNCFHAYNAFGIIEKEVLAATSTHFQDHPMCLLGDLARLGSNCRRAWGCCIMRL
jgi:hypothetical protein